MRLHTYQGGTRFEYDCVEFSMTSTEYLFCTRPMGCVVDAENEQGCFCCSTDNCNTRLFYYQEQERLYGPQSSSIPLPTPVPSSVPTGPPTPTPTPDLDPPDSVRQEQPVQTGVIIIVVLLCVSIVVVGALIMAIIIVHCIAKTSSNCEVETGVSASSSSEVGDPNTMLMEGTSSGSGMGMPILAQRSIAQEICLLQLIGRGRYGEVWRGAYHGEDVAVKIFEAHEETSWTKEAAVYETCLLQHRNILRFIGADNRDMHFCTQRWLVFELCELGNLYDYLQNHTLPENVFCVMALGVVSGVAHLHEEVHGQVYKPGIAHRDLKSSNIMVRSDQSCCIGDLGLAVRSNTMREVFNDPSKAVVGTKRYLAPEILDGSINAKSFLSFVRADMYSLSLILWEMACRVVAEDKAYEYQLPYQEFTARDPSTEDMRLVVCEQGKRPYIPHTWEECSTLSVVSRAIQECWDASPTTRLSALRVKKTLQSLPLSSKQALIQAA